MKKIVGFIITLGLIVFVFQFLITFFKNNHIVDYVLISNENKISVHEEYIKDSKVDYYYFKVNIGDNIFVFDIDNSFNKQKQIVKDIMIYEDLSKDILCISPVYVKNNFDSRVYCSIDKKQYSYNSIKDLYDLSSFTSTLSNFDNNNYENDTNLNGVFNHDNSKIGKDEKIIIYKYNYLQIITNVNNNSLSFSKYDVYDNKLGILIDNYYVMPSFDNKYEYNSFIIINMKDEKKEVITFDKPLSTQLYINGVVDHKLYIFDKSNLNQYEIDPKNKSYRIVGNKDTKGQYYDGSKWFNKNIYDFIGREIKFGVNIPIKVEYEGVYETDKFYYYYTVDGNFYKVYKKDINKSIYLFQYDNVKEVKVVNDNVYFISDNALYRFNDYRIDKLVINYEFLYNYKNIYSVYFD